MPALEKENPSTTPAVFFDRDGTLMQEVHYCSEPKKVAAIAGAAEALAELKEGGYLNVIITNQSGIGRGYFTVEQFEQVQAELLRQLGSANIDATFFCPDSPDSPAPRRKPSPVMVFEAAASLAIDLKRSFFIGDAASDIECGRAAGLRTILVKTGYGQRDAHCQPDFTATNVTEAVAMVLEMSKSG